MRFYYHDASGNETIYFYGVDGRKLSAFQITGFVPQGYAKVVQLTQQNYNVYLARVLVAAQGWTVYQDRVGSASWPTSSGNRYYPYGVEYSPTANDREKYATYTRDSLTGLDYAVNRYYSSIWGRFLSADPYVNSAGLEDPGSWNRYAYTGGDPINRGDPSGACWQEVPYEDPIWVPCFDDMDGMGASGQSGGRFRPNPDPPDRNMIGDKGPPDCDVLLTSAMESFLKSHSPGLLTKDPDFVSQVMKAAAENGVDPRLFIAETGESGWGTSNAAMKLDNPFRLMVTVRTKRGIIQRSIDFALRAANATVGFGNAVNVEGTTLSKYAGETIEQMYSGQRGEYCQDPRCPTFGEKTIADALTKMGGDPNNLKYPQGQVGGIKCH